MIELSLLLFLGILAQWLSWRIKVPSILPLIIIGLLVGPFSTLLTADGSKFIDGDALFEGNLLFDFVSLAVGVILFEGGLTLKLREVKFLVGPIRNLIIFGSAISFVGGAIAAYYLVGLDIRLAFLFGALVIVTGPTVVAPLLRNIRPNASVNTVLKWESILIDPIGALAAVLVYEFIVSGDTNGQFTFYAFRTFFSSLLTGALVGIVTAFLLFYLLRQNFIPKFLRNVATLALVVLSFAVSDYLHHESGLLAVTVAGIILANLKLDELHDILSFKEDITIILLSLLFIILSSRIDLIDLNLLGWNVFWLFLVIVLFLRPLAVFLSTLGSSLTFKERLFISLICPRGIVAAGVASIFSLRLSQNEDLTPAEVADANLLLPLTFMVIVGTVITQSLYGTSLAKALGVRKVHATGIMILGADEAARYIALLLKSIGIQNLLIDVSHRNVEEANAVGLDTYEGDIFSDTIFDDIDMSQYNYLMALTPGTELNIMASRRMRPELGPKNSFRIISRHEQEISMATTPSKNLLFHQRVDFIELTQLVRKKPELKEMLMEGDLPATRFYELHPEVIPIFIKETNNAIVPVSGYNEIFKEGQTLLYFEKG
jgi:NhaP-type Na+/H+ or K+/H+ antiporter